MNDSWESYYQCIRRCYRFGQKHPVNVSLVISDAESEIYTNVQRKEEQAAEMATELIRNVQAVEVAELKGRKVKEEHYAEDTQTGDGWTAMLGDSCKRLKEIADDSIHLSVYSPPFANLYTYSASERDLGNCQGWEKFFAHYSFIIRELLRVTLPGRLTAVHSSDIPAMLVKDGYIGFKDFPGEIIKAYIASGWIFHGRITIDKDPQAQAIRTKAKGLSFGQMEKDASWCRPALGDYIVLFRKPGENAMPIQPIQNKELTRDLWIEWARPVWYGISEGDTLQYTTARDAEDERHICPLQLGVIERCIKLWSNPGETVLTPFGGIGSEAYQAIKFGRKAVLCELKPSYFRIAVQNLRKAEQDALQGTLYA
jgi:DNA modification methylase